MSKYWKKAAIASAIVSLVIAFIEYFIFSGGTIYVSHVEWAKVETLPYREAQKYLAERAEHISNLQSTLNGITYSRFWLVFLYEVFVYFVVSFASCFLFARLWQYNKSLNTDAGDAGAG